MQTTPVVYIGRKQLVSSFWFVFPVTPACWRSTRHRAATTHRHTGAPVDMSGDQVGRLVCGRVIIRLSQPCTRSSSDRHDQPPNSRRSAFANISREIVRRHVDCARLTTDHRSSSHANTKNCQGRTSRKISFWSQNSTNLITPDIL